MADHEIIDHQTSLEDTIASSDYGSDIDIDFLDEAVEVTATRELTSAADAALQEAILPDDLPDIHPRALRLCKAWRGGSQSSTVAPTSSQPIELAYDEPVKSATIAAVSQDQLLEQRQTETQAESVLENDTRSPLQRFRTPPRKPLSVTDLVSPAWCERQYWYSLTKYGRIKRTPAMKAGSKVHKEKELEVHTEVPIEVTTVEDKLGLRLWNIIQGLRTLRSTGLTRELEVFGLIGDQVVIGIIDEITYICPNPSQEAVLFPGDHGQDQSTKSLPPDQRTMKEFFQELGAKTRTSNRTGAAETQAIYLVDMKTRMSDILPKLGSQMRPTMMQLMLYHRLLTELASGQIDGDLIFERYCADGDQVFSDAFLAGLIDVDVSSSQISHESETEIETMHDEVLQHNTLRSLWKHMVSEFAMTISSKPSESSGAASISEMLTADFRSPHGIRRGEISFRLNRQQLDTYINQVMDWWRGKRESMGVEVEEAYKCRSCEFAEVCEWRANKIEVAVDKARSRRRKAAG